MKNRIEEIRNDLEVFNKNNGSFKDPLFFEPKYSMIDVYSLMVVMGEGHLIKIEEQERRIRKHLNRSKYISLFGASILAVLIASIYLKAMPNWLALLSTSLSVTFFYYVIDQTIKSFEEWYVRRIINKLLKKENKNDRSRENE